MLLDSFYKEVVKYCPPYAAPNKAGCPKKNKRIIDGNLKSPPLFEVPRMVMVSGKKAKGTNDKVDGNLKSPPIFQETGKVMVSGNIMNKFGRGARVGEFATSATASS